MCAFHNSLKKIFDKSFVLSLALTEDLKDSSKFHMVTFETIKDKNFGFLGYYTKGLKS